MKINYATFCSGIEAATVAFEPLGWQPVFFSEVDAFCNKVLQHHWPHVTNVGDMRNFIRDLWAFDPLHLPELLLAGTPCQDFSIAGKQEGLQGERGQLTLEYARIIDEVDNARKEAGLPPLIAGWENVPGVMSNCTNPFGQFISKLAGCGEVLNCPGKRWPNSGAVFGPQRTVAWRILDAQFFGVAQRRRRVFVIASSRKGFNPLEVLFEFDGVRRDTEPRRKTRESDTTFPGQSAEAPGEKSIECVDVAPTLRAGANTTGGDRPPGTDVDTMETLIVEGYGTSGAGWWREGIGPLRGESRGAIYDQVVVSVHGTQDPGTAVELAHALGGNYGQENTICAFAENSRSELRLESGDGQVTGALSTGGGKAGQGTPMIAALSYVRRLMPVECERLQGFQDGHTDIPIGKKRAADGPRYKSIGNSKAVPVVQWIGRRIENNLKKYEEEI